MEMLYLVIMMDTWLHAGWVNTQIMFKNRQRLEGEAFDPSKVRTVP
jgi:hypothetical protein